MRALAVKRDRLRRELKQYPARQLPFSRPRTWLRPTLSRPRVPAEPTGGAGPGPARPRTAARGGRRWSRVCTSAPASDAAGVTARAAVARRAPAREALALLPARGRAWASVSQTPETFWPQTQALPLPAPCLRPWTVTFWSRKRCDTISVYGTHLFLDLILPRSKLQKRMAAQECCTPFSQALVSSPGGVSGTTVIG